MNVKPGLYFARKGQDVPRWMWEVTGGNSDTVTDYKFKFSVNCKVLVKPISLVTVMMPVKRHFIHVLYFDGGGLCGANVSFKPNHNVMFFHGVKYQRLREQKASTMQANRNYDNLSSIGIARKIIKFKNKAKVKNISEAYL